MALIINQRPSTSDVHGAYEQLMYSLSSTDQQSASNFNFRYIADLYVGGVMVSRVKVFPNTNGQGIIRVDKLIQDFLAITKADQNVLTDGYYTDTIHTLGVNLSTAIFSKNNGETFRKVELKFGQEYGNSATATPTVYLNEITGEYIDVIMSAGLRRLVTWDEGIPFWSYDSDWLNTYINTSANSYFLSDRTQANTAGFGSSLVPIYTPIVIDVFNLSYYTLGMLMDSSAPTSTTLQSVYVAAYKEDGTLIYGTHLIPGTDGGVAPGSVSNDSERLQFLGIGPGNLFAQTLDASLQAAMINADLGHYEVVGMNDTTTVPSSATTANMTSTVYRFNINKCGSIYQNANTYPNITIAWQNSFGAYDYQIFNLKDEFGQTIERKTFDQVAGNWDTANASQDWNFRGDEGGTRVAQVQSRQTLTATTDLLQESDVELLETLMISPSVFLISGFGNSLGVAPIVVKDTSFLKKRRVNERQPFLYQVRFEFAKPRPTTKGGTYRGY